MIVMMVVIIVTIILLVLIITNMMIRVTAMIVIVIVMIVLLLIMIIRPTSLLTWRAFRGSDSSIILISRGGILMSIGDFKEGLSQAVLVVCNFSRRIGRTILSLNITVSRFVTVAMSLTTVIHRGRRSSY